MLRRVRPPERLEGRLRLPGDKSISHRALIFNAIAEGEARVTNLSPGEDVASTARCLAQLGRPLGPAAGPLDCGNSGTTMRLLAGLLAAQPFESVLVGDESLSRRPMERVAEPLRRLGLPADAGPPLRVGGDGPPHGGEVVLATPSAQVKSALLLAGLYATAPVTVVERVRTRDHTERLLAAMGARVSVDGLRVTVAPGRLHALDIDVPADLSAAAFWLVAAAIHPSARVELAGVGVNPTRAAVLELLPGVERHEREGAGEPVADLVASSAPGRRPLRVDAELAARVIDELPVLAVLAAATPGESRFSGARELRVKESDRIATMAEGLRALGAHVEELEDGWVIRGGTLRGARVRSHGDHRVAMALAVAGLVAEGETEVEGAECVAISYPGFWDDLDALCR